MTETKTPRMPIRQICPNCGGMRTFAIFANGAPTCVSEDACIEALIKETKMQNGGTAHRYKATWNGEYLFHVMGLSDSDALSEAQKCAENGYLKKEVVSNLVVELDEEPVLWQP